MAEMSFVQVDPPAAHQILRQQRSILESFPTLSLLPRQMGISGRRQLADHGHLVGIINDLAAMNMFSSSYEELRSLKEESMN